MANVTINLQNSSPGTTTVSHGDHVTFHNSLQTETTLTLPSPSCFAPPPTSPQQLASGADAGPYTISANATGDYTYGYTVGGAALGTRSGTIKV
jgi:plastocyanin